MKEKSGIGDKGKIRGFKKSVMEMVENEGSAKAIGSSFGRKEKNLQIKEKGKKKRVACFHESVRKTGSEYDGWYEKDRYSLQFLFFFLTFIIIKKGKKYMSIYYRAKERERERDGEGLIRRGRKGKPHVYQTEKRFGFYTAVFFLSRTEAMDFFFQVPEKI